LQMHLSTAILMMIVAGFLMWANVKERAEWFGPELQAYYGWPRYAVRKDAFFHDAYGARLARFFYGRNGITLDIAVALAILFALWYASERWIRRRAGRKGTERKS